MLELYNGLDAEDEDLRLFHKEEQYREEFADYIDGFENCYAYSSQWCEADSEKYAEEAVIDYYYRINQYNKEHLVGEENE